MFGMKSYFLFYIGKNICVCFNLNGGSFIYLKPKDVDFNFGKIQNIFEVQALSQALVVTWSGS